MKPDVFQTITIEIQLEPGNGLTERGSERLSDAIQDALYDGDIDAAVWGILRKRLPEEFSDFVMVRAR